MEGKITRPEFTNSTRQNQLGQAIGAKGAQTRRRLLDATEELLRTTSLLNLNVPEITHLAKTSRATFYVYFNDVSEAVLTLIGGVSQSPPNVLALFAEPWTDEASDLAHDFVARYSQHWHDHAALFRVRNLGSDEGNAQYSAARFHAISPLMNAIASHVEQRQAAGELPADLHPASAASALLALVERLAMVQLARPRLGVTKARLSYVAAFLAFTLVGRGQPIAGSADRTQVRGRARAEAPRSDPPPKTDFLINNHGQTVGPKGARTRRRLMDATSELLSNKPFREVSATDISRHAGTSTATFYLYFEGVSEATLAVIDEISQSTPEMLELCAACWNAPNSGQATIVFIRRYIEHWQEHRALLRVRNLASDEGDVRFVQARSRAVQPLLDLITQRIADRQACGLLPTELHPRSAAGAAVAMIERLAATSHVTTNRGVALDSICRTAAFLMAALTGDD